MTDQGKPNRGAFDDLPAAGPEHDGHMVINVWGGIFECVYLTDVFEAGDGGWYWQAVRNTRDSEEE